MKGENGHAGSAMESLVLSGLAPEERAGGGRRPFLVEASGETVDVSRERDHLLVGTVGGGGAHELYEYMHSPHGVGCATINNKHCLGSVQQGTDDYERWPFRQGATAAGGGRNECLRWESPVDRLRRWAMAPRNRAWLFGNRQTWHDWSISLWSEFLGTFLMVFVGVGVGVRVGTTKPVNAMTFFMVIIFIVEAFVPFSGAHFNPVVTMVMFMSGVTNACLFVLHTLVQCVAATVASYLMLLLLPEASENNCGVTTVTDAWHDPIGIWKAICLEAIMTGTLIYVILTTGLHSKSKERNALSTLAVACTVATLILFGGDLTGTSMNPARSLGPAIACGYWDYQWIYFVGPPLGSVVAWLAYTLTHHKSCTGGNVQLS